MKLSELESVAIDARVAQNTLVILLHGYAMAASDLAPFARSLGVPALFMFPQGPLTAHLGGHAWWAIDPIARRAALTSGPRDLANAHPAGLAKAREQLDRYVQTCRLQFEPQRLVVGGFSQGGMLACDWVLHSGRQVDALMLFSASRLNFCEWTARHIQLENLAVLLSHGRQDPDLAFEAGERLRDFAIDSRARVTWVPFEGGHEIPLPVWRSVRKFLRAMLE